MTALSALWRAIAFLSRIPAPGWIYSGGPHPLGRDVWAFALAGLVVALPAASILMAGHHADLSPLTSAALALAALVLVTGALHEDGLADIGDGLFGHHPPARALEIMKDSRVGTYGAVFLILSIILRVALLAELLKAGPAAGICALLAAASVSRGFMAVLWASLPSADPAGVAARVGQPSRSGASLAGGLGALVLVGLGTLGLGLPLSLAALALAVATFLGFRLWLKRRLGGQTGDALGAVQQLCEIAALIGFAIG